MDHYKNVHNDFVFPLTIKENELVYIISMVSTHFSVS